MIDEHSYSADLDAIDALVVTPGHKLVVDRLKAEILRKIGTEEREGELEKICDPANAAELRGYLKGIRTALRIPRILRDELKPKISQEPV